MLKRLFLFWMLSGCQVVMASTLGVSFDNDLLLGKDANYTNGLRVAWLSTPSAAGEQACGYRTSLCDLPGMQPEDGKQAWGVAIQQLMFTPDHIDRKTPDYTDIPYMGMTQLDASFYSWNDRRLTGYGVRLGTIGSGSLAKESQQFIHKVTGSKRPRGWDQQLGNSAMGGVYFIQSQRLLGNDLSDGRSWGSHLTYGADINNFVTSAKLMATISYGKHRNKRFVPDFSWLNTNAPLVTKQTTTVNGWDIFAGVSVERQFYDYMEQHAPSAYHLHARNWIGGVVAGASYHWSRVELRASVVASQDRYSREHGAQAFGNISGIWHF